MHDMKLALVHDSLNQLGGAEKVVLNFHTVYPTSPLYTLLYDPARLPVEFTKIPIIPSYISKLPFAHRQFKWFLMLMPSAFERFDFSDYDVVLSSTSALAKGILTGPNTTHICYCHTPTRYLWNDAHQYTKELHAPRFVKRMLPHFLSYLRMWDYLAAQRVDHFIANSATVAKRIETYYHRPATVIHPPVETSAFAMSNVIGEYYVALGRFRPYKRFDLIIQAFNKLGIPLKVIGTGEEQRRLKKMARSNIEFLGHVDDATRATIVAQARALIHPQEEDFGIAAVEAMSTGRPVIAYDQGGARETVIAGVTGTFFHEQSWESLADAVVRFDHSMFDPQVIQAHAQRYSEQIFQDRIRDFVESHAYKTIISPAAL